jgi:hypothetical protein
MPWPFLRSTYFTSEWAAARHLAQWAAEYGIDVSTEQRSAGPHTSEVEWVRFVVPGL